MSGPGYDRIVASTVLALVLAIPMGGTADAQQRVDPRIAQQRGQPRIVQQPSEPWISRQTDSWMSPQRDPYFAQPRPKAAIAPPRGKAAAGNGAASPPCRPRSRRTPIFARPAPLAGGNRCADPVASAPRSEPITAPKDAATSTPASGASAAGSGGMAPDAVPAAAPAADLASTPPPAPPPDPLAALDPADRPVAEKIRDLLAAKTDKIFTSKKERAAVDAFYQARNLAPLWLDKGIENARAKAAIARLKAAEAEGLVAADYKIPNLTGLAPDTLAEAELKLTQTVLTYARHLQAGRFPYNRVSASNIELAQQPPDGAEVLTRIAEAADAGAALEHYSPPHPGYKALKAKLAELRGSNAEEQKEQKVVGIPDGAIAAPRHG